MQPEKLIFDLSLTELQNTLQSWKEPSYRAEQVWQGLYQKLWDNPTQFSSLPTGLRQQINENFRFSAITPIQTLQSSDGKTTKILFELHDYHAVEAVLMQYEERNTVCISTQVGCAMGCAFCATGQMGYKRNLSRGEISAQVLYFARLLNTHNERLTNIVIMGMGEPFLNYDATLSSIDILNNPRGFNFGERRFTISTVGIIPMIENFTKEKRQINLAISLHAADNDLRSSLLPVNKKYPIGELMAACRDYVKATSRRITFEWALIQGVNDTPKQAALLGHLLKGMLSHVNLIPLNPTQRYAGEGSQRERVDAFKTELEKHGVNCTVRLRRGIDIQAGCGQLATKNVGG